MPLLTLVRLILLIIQSTIKKIYLFTSGYLSGVLVSCQSIVSIQLDQYNALNSLAMSCLLILIDCLRYSFQLNKTASHLILRSKKICAKIPLVYYHFQKLKLHFQPCCNIMNSNLLAEFVWVG